jgi:hypothetical protein
MKSWVSKKNLFQIHIKNIKHLPKENSGWENS